MLLGCERYKQVSLVGKQLRETSFREKRRDALSNNSYRSLLGGDSQGHREPDNNDPKREGGKLPRKSTYRKLGNLLVRGPDKRDTPGCAKNSRLYQEAGGFRLKKRRSDWGTGELFPSKRCER